MNKSQSDFGKGMVYNLILFTKHFNDNQAVKITRHHFVMDQSEETRQKILTNNPIDSHNYGWNQEELRWWTHIVPIYDNDPEYALSADICLWANGASDHLYEIEVTEMWKTGEIGLLIEELKDKGLTMGHGFTGQRYSYDDFVELKTLTKEIALKIDQALGISTIKGDCE